MVESLADEWKAEWRREGFEEGRQEGLEEGRRKGIALMLLLLIRNRFGDLPEWVRVRVEPASWEQLEGWIEKLLTAPSIDALFNEQQQ
jgi:predicted transposase YdaD